MLFVVCLQVLFVVCLQVPFSKLILSHDGMIQVDQEHGPHEHLDNVKKLSFTIADACTGDFRLELDYIAVQKNRNHREIQAYEKYDVPKQYLKS